ncbi:MAG: signal peptidase I [Candidatus Asgardarchaeum sp.]
MSLLSEILTKLNQAPKSDEDHYTLLFRILVIYILGFSVFYFLLPEYSLGLFLYPINIIERLIIIFVIGPLIAVVYTILSSPIIYFIWHYYCKSKYRILADFVTLVLSYVFSVLLMSVLGIVYLSFSNQNVSLFTRSLYVDFIRLIPAPFIGLTLFYLISIGYNAILYKYNLIDVSGNDGGLLKKIKKHEHDIKIVIIILLISGAIIGVNFGLSRLLNTSYPIVVVSSQSMVPNLNVGDILILKGVDPSEIHVGDIIVFRATWLPARSPLVVHRVVEIEIINNHYYFYTKGDNNLLPDPEPTPDMNVVGVVVFVIPKIGTITLFLQSSGLTVPIIIILLILLIYSFLSEKKEEKPKNKN